MGQDAGPVGQRRQPEARAAEVAGSEGGQIARRPHIVDGLLRDGPDLLRLPGPLPKGRNQILQPATEHLLIQLLGRDHRRIC